MELYPYQKRALNDVIEAFSKNNRVMLQLPTGGGKTFIFCNIAQHFKNTIILCHKSELIQQTCDTLDVLKISNQAIYAQTKHLKDVRVFVAMVQTLHNRLESGRFSFPDTNLLIVDEAHILIFDKLFKHFPFSKILGVSATPINDKRISFFQCDVCGHKTDKKGACKKCQLGMLEEYSRRFVFSEIYEKLIVGASMQELFEFGSIVREIPYSITVKNKGELKIDSTGEYSSKSLTSVFGSNEHIADVLKNYLEIAKGKKTLVFNPTTKVNADVYDEFINAGINAKMYDLTNTPSADRKELVRWFKSTPDAVLLSVGVFTTGFDVKEVECVILNRSTTSLALYIQMVGRGGRASNEIYKPNFTLIDLGGNIEEFGLWSDEQDWQSLFKNKDYKPKKKSDLIDTWDCECGAMNSKSDLFCVICGLEKPQKNIYLTNDIEVSDKIAELVIPYPLPNSDKIISYTLRVNQDKHFAFNLLYKEIQNLFKFHRVSRELYEKTKENGRLENRIKSIIRPVYFAIINKPEFKGGTNRTFNYVLNKTLEKIEKIY